MKSILLPPAALLAAPLLALAACNSEKTPEVLDANPDPMATQLANAAPVELPPAIKAEKTLRCKDNSLVAVTFFEGDKQAVVKSPPTGPSTVLKAEKSGDPLVADGGWKLTGTPASITLTQPGKGTLVCHP